MNTLSGPALDELQRRLGYQFIDRNHLLRALTHRSAQRDHNERLEFLGDALIGMIAAAYFYQRFPDEDEGTLSRLRSSVVRGSLWQKLLRDWTYQAVSSLGKVSAKVVDATGALFSPTRWRP